VEIYGEEVLKFNRFKKKLLFLNKINHAHWPSIFTSTQKSSWPECHPMV
jgi:hypothetical protein